MGTITSAGSGNWGTGATWVGGAVPVNGDAVVIADGHAIVFDVDQSGFAAGIAGLTLGANSTLTASTSAGAYYLKMAGNITASGAGAELRAGTAETAYPTNCTFTIYMNGNYSIDGGASNTLTCKFYCYDPPVKYLRLISATPKAITGISKEATCTVTCVGHGKSAGDIIYLVNVGGMVELNNCRVRVKTVVGPDSFTIRAYDADVVIDSTSFTTYTSGGYVCPETAEAAGQTVLEVDLDVSADAEWTRSGSTVRICNTNRSNSTELKNISSVASGSVTVTSGITAKHSSSIIVLTTRNINIVGTSTTITNGLIYRMVGGFFRCSLYTQTTATNIFNACSFNEFCGVAQYFNNCFNQCTNNNIGGVIGGNGISGITAGSNNLINGFICGVSTGITRESSSAISATIIGCSTGTSGLVGCTTTGCVVSSCSTGASALSSSIGDSVFPDGLISHCAVGTNGFADGVIGAVVSCTSRAIGTSTSTNNRFLGSVYSCNYVGTSMTANYFSGRIAGCNIVFEGCRNCLFHNLILLSNSNNFSTSKTLFAAYDSSLGEDIYRSGFSRSDISTSINHNGVNGAFRAWTRGGITSSTATDPPTGRVRSYQTVCESATYPGWYQREIVVDAGRQLRLRVWLKADAGVEIKAQLVLPTADPLITGTGTGEWQQIGTSDGTWYEYVTSWTNSATYPVTIYARVLSTAESGNGYSDMMWAFDRTPLVR